MAWSIMKVLLLGYIFAGLTWAQQKEAEVFPKEMAVQEGEQAEFICRAGQPIDSCIILFPSGDVQNLHPDHEMHRDDMEYVGEGFQAGQCGIRLMKTDMSKDGVYKCFMSTHTSISGFHGEMKLNIMSDSKPPMESELHLFNTYKDYYDEGDILNANCIVKNARSDVNITWYMGQEKIKSGDKEMKVMPKSEHAKFSDLKTVAQNISLPVTLKDHGKWLRCVAQHVGVNDTDQYTEADIQVRISPQRNRNVNSEEDSGEEDEGGAITHLMAAYPQLRMRWRDYGRDEDEGYDEYQ